MKKKADSLVPRVSQPCPALEKPAPCWEQGLFRALEVIVRQSMNGHPLGHDAMVAAERLLKRCAVDVMGRPAHLQCRCTPCSQARKAIKASLQQQRQADEWNRAHALGTRVRVNPADQVPFFGSDVPGATTTEAFVYVFEKFAICGGGPRACVKVNSLPLPVPLEWCTVLLAGGADATAAAANNNPLEES